MRDLLLDIVPNVDCYEEFITAQINDLESPIFCKRALEVLIAHDVQFNTELSVSHVDELRVSTDRAKQGLEVLFALQDVVSSKPSIERILKLNVTYPATKAEIQRIQNTYLYASRDIYRAFVETKHFADMHEKALNLLMKYHNDFLDCGRIMSFGFDKVQIADPKEIGEQIVSYACRRFGRSVNQEMSKQIMRCSIGAMLFVQQEYGDVESAFDSLIKECAYNSIRFPNT